MEALGVIVALAFVIGLPVLSIWAMVRATRLRNDVAWLKIEVAALRSAAAGTAPPVDPAPEAAPFAAPRTPTSQPLHTQSARITTAAPPESGSPGGPPVTETPVPDQSGLEAPPSAPADRTRDGDFEEKLASRWLVWLGAATISLGGAFLVKYSIDQGWLRPAIRVTLGFLLGVVLVIGGEWLRRRPLQRAVAAISADYVPPALTAAGLFTAFASAYAAFALYDLLPPLAAFLLLAIVAVCGVALSLLQGPFIALLGLLGGFLTPVLVPSDQPSAWSLFGYLAALVVGGLAVVRYTAWWWLAWCTLAGGGFWVVLWFVTAWSPEDTTAISIYLLLLASVFIFLRDRAADAEAIVTWQDLLSRLSMSQRIAWGASLAMAELAYMLVRMDAYGPVSFAALAAFVGFYLLVARREAALDTLAIVAAILALAVIATWHVPEIIAAREPLFTVEGRPYGLVRSPVVPPELWDFASATAGLGILLGVGGFVAMWGARRPALWAGVSAATPVLMLAVAYWRVEALETDFGWAMVALALAGLAVAAAARVERDRALPGFTAGLGAYAAATVAALALAMAMALEQAWLTVALSLQLPALAWIAERLRLGSIRWLAMLVAGVVLVRLVLNYKVLNYPVGELPGLNWLLYGYGIPAAAFYYSARRFRRAADDNLVAMLEAGALAFFVLLVTFEIRTLIAGSLDSADYSLLEQSLQSIAWLGMSYGLAVRCRADGRPVLRWGWRGLAVIAAAQVVLLQAVAENPLWSSVTVGDSLVFDLLFLAYAVPAAFALLFARLLRHDGEPRLALTAGILGLLLIFLYLSLEVRHFFQGAVLSVGATTDAEWYSYSVLWLGYAGALLALGLRIGSPWLRYASLTLVMVTVGKVFLSDMSDLTGLYRVASFLGLGLCLVGIGYLYQRFVFTRDPAPDKHGGPEQGIAAGST